MPPQETNCSKTVGDYLSEGKLEMGLMRVEQVCSQHPPFCQPGLALYRGNNEPSWNRVTLRCALFNFLFYMHAKAVCAL